MNIFAVCRNCKLSLRLLPPEPSQESKHLLLLNEAEMLPLKLNEQARWLFVCPECQGVFVPSFTLSRESEEDTIVYANSLHDYRNLREGALREIDGKYLGKMFKQTILPAWFLSCGLEFLWGVVTLQQDVMLFASLCTFFSSCVAVLAVVYMPFEICAFIGTFAWLIAASFWGRIESVISFGMVLAGWCVSLRGILMNAKGDALIAVEQELLQLRLLKVVPRYWVKAESPYR
jgi:hypothetical protein